MKIINFIFILFLTINFLQSAVADAPYEEMKIEFNNAHDANEFTLAYKENDLKKYFLGQSLSEPENMSQCIYQEYFIENFKQKGNVINIIVADEISYYSLKGKNKFSKLLHEWSRLNKLKIIYHMKDHFSYSATSMYINGDFIKPKSENDKYIKESKKINSTMMDYGNYICKVA